MSFVLGRTNMGKPPRTATRDGDGLDVSGMYCPSDPLVDPALQGKAAEIQLSGLSRGDVVPVVLDSLSGATGFYRVRSVSVEDVRGVRQSGMFRYAAQLDRVGGFSSPVFELVVSAGDRGASGPAELRYVGVPNSATSIRTNAVRAGLYSATGNVLQVDRQTETLSANSDPVSFKIAPADYYDAATTIEFRLGDVWFPLVGRQVPSVADVGAVRISNGLVRATMVPRPSPGSPTHTILFESWRRTIDQWVVFSRTIIASSTTVDATSTLIASTPPTVTRNDPDGASISVNLVAAGTLNVSGTLSMSLNRGATFFSCSTYGYHNSLTSTSVNQYDPDGDIPGTVRDGGGRRTSAVDGSVFYVMSAGSTFDTADSSLTMPAVGYFGDADFGVGVIMTSDTFTGVPAEPNRHYWGAVSTRQRAVAE